MTSANAAPIAPPATQRRLQHRLLIIARLVIVVLATLLVIVAIPNFYNRQHTVSIGGVFAQFDRSGELVITRVVSGTPSAQAGLLRGDVLVAVNDLVVDSSMTPATLNTQINGLVNTPLTLTVRTGSASPRTFTINRTVDPSNYMGRLATLGINLDFIAGYMIAVDLIVLISYLVVSYILISRGPGTPLAYFASITLVTLGAAATYSMQFLAREPSAWGWLANALISTGFAAGFTFLGFLYPDGQWVPRRSFILVAIVWVWTVLQWVWPEARPANWDTVIAILVYLVMIIAMFVAQTRRYRHIATPAQRQQIKWFVLALASFLVCYAISQLASLVIATTGVDLSRVSALVILVLWQISILGYQIPYALIAVAIGLALLRHRLWDIDIVINQSLVYSTLTATLAISSAVLLAVLNNLIGQLFGSASSLLVVIITAAFPVAAFNPLRTRIQWLVDRRLKPEEVSFSETSTLLTLEVQALLTPNELLETLVRAVATQLDLLAVAAYTVAADGRLLIAHVTAPDAEMPSELILDVQTLEKLKHGQIVAPEDTSAWTFLVPLTAARTHALGLCGALALGPRRNGKGYTTPLERGLHELGHEAGKALYVAQLRETSLQNVAGRVAALEKQMAGLKQEQ